MDERIATLAREIPSLTTPEQVRERRRALLALVRQRFQTLGELEPVERHSAGIELNARKQEVERLATERLRQLEAAESRGDAPFDPDLPVPPAALAASIPPPRSCGG